MMCANHPGVERVAFCQNCGKALCGECVRKVGTSILCEPCLAARVAAGAGYGGPFVPGEPSPGVAAILGFIPGVGAMYNGQYAKGLVHILVFSVLVSLASDVNGIFGLFVAGWIFYQVIEAHHTARSRRDGTPLPNPFGLNDLAERLGFGRAWPGAAPGTPHPGAGGQSGPTVPPARATTTGASANATSYPYVPDTHVPDTSAPYTSVPPASSGVPQDSRPYGATPVPPYIPTTPFTPSQPASPYVDPNQPYGRRFPAGAVWLIALGVLFLLSNAGLFHVLRAKYFVPILLIAAGVYNFVRRMTDGGGRFENDGTPMYSMRLARALSGSAFIVLVGVLFLLNSLRVVTWSHSWPFFLIVLGVVLLLKRGSYGGYGYAAEPPISPYSPTGPYSPPNAYNPGNPYVTPHPAPAAEAPAASPSTAIVAVPHDLASRDMPSRDINSHDTSAHDEWGGK